MRCSRTIHLVLIASLLSATGAQWAVLQCAAWAGMVVRRMQTQSASHAIATTFDGRHPCRLCQQLRKGAQSARKQEATRTRDVRLVLFFQAHGRTIRALKSLWALADFSQSPGASAGCLDTPPPRLLSA